MERFRASRVRRPVNFFVLLAWSLALFLDERSKSIRLFSRSRCVDQIPRLKSWIEVEIQQRSCSSRKHQRREKFLAELFTADDVEISVSHANGLNGHQSKR